MESKGGADEDNKAYSKGDDDEAPPAKGYPEGGGTKGEAAGPPAASAAFTAPASAEAKDSGGGGGGGLVGGGAAVSGVAGGRALIEAACGFYFDDEGFQRELEGWANARCAAFSPLDTEYSLAQTDLFDEFRTLFEAQFERFLGSLGATVDSLYNEIKRDTSKDFYSGHTLVAVINAAVDFKNFHAMMCDARAGEMVWGMPPLADAETGELLC